MNKTLQAKHLDEQEILRALQKQSQPMTHWASGTDRSLPAAIPALRVVPEKVLRAKLGAMERRGLIDGCACGCRGDWVITPLGAEQLRGDRP
jgi:hypothetical protein